MMAKSNRDRVGQGLDLLLKGLRGWAKAELMAAHGSGWWRFAVDPALQGPSRDPILRSGDTPDEWWENIDLQALFNVMWQQWNTVFRDRLDHDARSYINELRTARNEWAHQQAFSNDEAYRALETMRLLLQACGVIEEQEAIGDIASEVLRIKFEKDMNNRREQTESLVTATGTSSYLKPWREVATPRKDVREGRFVLSEYAADLHQVFIGKATDEYKNPREFFQRTYITRGMNDLLVGAVRRLSGQRVNPVLQLKTSFGGGKTHSLIALYHLFSGSVALSEHTDLASVAKQAEVTFIPKANRAVLVGTMLDATKPSIKSDGTIVRTMWGEMAWQLGGAEAYEQVRSADELSTAPGADTLVKLFDDFAPSLVLIDEFVAYARNIRGKDGLPAGNFDNLLSFLQSLTEAAARSEAALLVVSLPESLIEQGGEAGRDAYAQVDSVLEGQGRQDVLSGLQHTMGRVEALWRPADRNESFEIVRRRLFEPIEDTSSRGKVVEAFVSMYRNDPTLYPPGCAETDYRERMLASYPIHTEVFDRLYGDWSSLERFQQTRGVLRLMAYIVHYLWAHEDKSLMVLPSMIPVGDDHVREEFRRYVGDEWAAVFDSDIDGILSKSFELDSQNQAFGRYSAARRVARAIFLGSAPSKDEGQRGLDAPRIRLGTVMPGEQGATFKDALDALQRSATYLYSDGGRYWFKTQPSINRVAEGRAHSYDGDQVLDWIAEELQGTRGRELLSVHYAVSSPSDVPDDEKVRLAVLSPRYPHRHKGIESEALKMAVRMVQERQGGPRTNRNMILFMAADADKLGDLVSAMRWFRAWSTIHADMEDGTLNLDQAQMRQVRERLNTAKRDLASTLSQAYQWMLVPKVNMDGGKHDLYVDPVRLSQSGDFVGRAIDKLTFDGLLLQQMGGEMLQRELDKWLWKDANHLGVAQVWAYLRQYLYLPRVLEVNIYLNAIRDAIGGFIPGPFAYASKYDESNNRYLDLAVQGVEGSRVQLTADTVLVRADVAAGQRQADEEESRRAAGETTAGADGPGTDHRGNSGTATGFGNGSGLGREGQGGYDAGNGHGSQGAGAGTATPAGPKQFFGRKQLNADRLVADVSTVADEVIEQLLQAHDSDVEIVIEVRAQFAEGIDRGTRRALEENCRTLGFDEAEFE